MCCNCYNNWDPVQLAQHFLHEQMRHRLPQVQWSYTRGIILQTQIDKVWTVRVGLFIFIWRWFMRVFCFLGSNKLVNSLKSTSVVPSQVYVAASPNTETIHPLLIGLPGFGTTPGSNDTAMTAAPKRSITSALRSNSAAAAASLKAVSKNRRKRRRRHHNTPWYARVQRYRRWTIFNRGH